MRRPRTLGQRDKAERLRTNDAERRRAKPWRRWYSLRIWADIRDGQLSAQPLCERCSKVGRTRPATVCNHVVPHRGDWNLFVGGPFESVCKACHDSVVRAEERAAARSSVDED